MGATVRRQKGILITIYRKHSQTEGAFSPKLMYKTAVYRLVNGGITHQKQQISEKGDDAAIRSPMCQYTAAQYHLIVYGSNDHRL